MNDAIEPIFLRHTKQQIGILQSKKTEIILWCDYSQTQQMIVTAFMISRNFRSNLSENICN